MENLIYCCPICRGKVLVEETIAPQPEHAWEIQTVAKVYCPHCEMLVEPVAVSPVAAHAESAVNTSDAGDENRGRSREGGTNAGGSQRGDLSDQGATQWRHDPLESERNTWRDKD